MKMGAEAISSLSRLDELNIRRGFTIWEDADITSIYVELNKLTWLRKLTISLPCSQFYLDGDIMSNLQEFNISVGSIYYDSSRDLFKKSISFKVNHIESGWMALIKRAEEAYLDGVEGLFNDSMHTEAFANMKKLEISSCNDMDHLVSLPMDGRNQPMPYFSNLSFLIISNCWGLTYLFSASVAKYLLKIQQLKVSKCDAIEEIVRDNNEEVIISFPKLKVLHLHELPRLKCFSTRKIAIPSLEELDISGLESASEIWGKDVYNKEHSTSFSQLKVVTVHNCDNLETVVPVTLVREFNNLEAIDIEDCVSLKTVFQLSSIATDIGNLNQTEGGRMVFSSLTKLSLQYLPNIESIWSYETVEVTSNKPPKVSFPNLEEFRVCACETSGLTVQIELGRDDDFPSRLIKLELSYVDEAHLFSSQWPLQLQNLEELSLENCKWNGPSFFNTPTLTLNRLVILHISECEFGPTLIKSSLFRSLQRLQQLSVYRCHLLEDVVEDIGMDDEKMISLPQLRSLQLCYLRSLKSFSQSSSYAFNMPALNWVFLNG